MLIIEPTREKVNGLGRQKILRIGSSTEKTISDIACETGYCRGLGIR